MFVLVDAPWCSLLCTENAASWTPGPRRLPSMTLSLCTHTLGSRLQALAYGSWSDLMWRKGGDKGDVLKPNIDMVSGGDTTTACSRGSTGIHRQAQGHAVATRRHSDRSNSPTQPPQDTRGARTGQPLRPPQALPVTPTQATAMHRPSTTRPTQKASHHGCSQTHSRAVASGRRCKLQQLPLTPSDSSNDRPSIIS